MQVLHSEQKAIVISLVYLKNQDSTMHHNNVHTQLALYTHTDTHTPLVWRWQLCRPALPLISSLPAFVDDSCCFAQPGICLLSVALCSCCSSVTLNPRSSVSRCLDDCQPNLGQDHPKVRCPTCQSCKYVITTSPQCGERKEVKICHKSFPKSSRVGYGYYLISCEHLS